MTKQTVTRTRPTRKGYYYNFDDYCRLNKLLEDSLRKFDVLKVFNLLSFLFSEKRSG